MITLILVLLLVLHMYQFGKFYVAKNCEMVECFLTIGIGPVIYHKGDIKLKILPIWSKVDGYKTRNAAPILGGVALIYLLTVIMLSGYNMYEGVPTSKVLCANPDSIVKIGDIITEDYGNVLEVKRGNRYLRYVLDKPVQIEFVKTNNPFKAVVHSVEEITNTTRNIISAKPNNNAVLEVICLETMMLFIIDLFGWFLRWTGFIRIKNPAKPDMNESIKDDLK